METRSETWSARISAMARACGADVARIATGATGALGIGAIACIACCAGPLVLGGFGLGSAAAVAATVGAAIEPWLGVATGVMVALVVVVVVLRSRAPRASTVADGATCSTSGACGTAAAPPQSSCGCGPSPDSIYTSPVASPDEPVACTARLDQGGQDQLAGYRAVFPHLVSKERFEGGFVWRFRGGEALETELRRLAEAEHGCCRFFSFRLTREGRDIVWETRSHASATVVDEYFRLPETMATTVGNDEVVGAFERAGLTFTELRGRG